ncbi:MAG: 50S ribosomal protein L17 [Syntrophales bacterium]|nr:50S ribosomal protein L17 [Syntrophales bacterium]NLN60627.1 50S ribosomal protein L17 [Deltaproteobacteria bacterium]
MRHGYQKKKMGRPTAHREAMLRNMVTSLLKHEKITTTDSRAKELKKLAEKMITLGKRGELHARRQALTVVRERDVVEKVFSEYAERYRERKGGYTRIIKLGFRAGDNAPVSVVEFVKDPEEVKTKTEAKTKSKAKVPVEKT